MKRFGIVLLGTFLLLGTLSSCTETVRSNKFGEGSNGLYLHSDMSIEEVMYYDFDPDKYDVEEYREFLDKDIAAYNKTHKVVATSHTSETHVLVSAVSVVKCEVTKKQLHQQILYATDEDYMEFAADTIAEKNGSTVVTGDFTSLISGMEK